MPALGRGHFAGWFSQAWRIILDDWDARGLVPDLEGPSEDLDGKPGQRKSSGAATSTLSLPLLTACRAMVLALGTGLPDSLSLSV